MKRLRIIAIGAIVFISISMPSCGKTSPSDDIISIITATENKLHKAKSIDKISDIQFGMLDSITHCLDVKHKGYRYVEGSEDYKAIMKRLARYNIIYCRSLSRYNPELNTETGNQDKVVEVLALMKKMEHQALTAPYGFDPNNEKAKNKNRKDNTNAESGRSINTTFIETHKENTPSMKNIERSVEGVTLGKTTKQELVTKLKDEAIPFEFEGNGEAIIIFKQVSYGGLIWWGYGCHFNNDIVDIVGYVKWTKTDYDEDSLNKDYDFLYNNILKRYNKKVKVKNNEFWIKDRSTMLKIKRITSSPQKLRFILTDLLVDENYDEL